MKLVLVKVLLYIYTIITLPIYYIIQKPWKERRKAKCIHGTQLDAQNPNSAWIRAGPPLTCSVGANGTVTSHISSILNLYSNNRCLGYRKVNEEIRDVQQNGKIHIRKALAPEYTWLTFAEVDAKVQEFAIAFTLYGIKPGDYVIIFMESRLEWMLCFLALNRIGAIVGTLHNALSEDSIVYAANLMESTVLVTTAGLCKTIGNIASQLKHLRSIIHLDNVHYTNTSLMQTLTQHFQVTHFDEMVSLAKQHEMSHSEWHKPVPDDLVLIMFTSGSTGIPKGVYFNNTAFLASIKTANSNLNGWNSSDVHLALLPMAHIYELLIEITVMSDGGAIGYSSPFTFNDHGPGLAKGCRGDAYTMRPTVTALVPLIFEKLMKQILDDALKKSKFHFELLKYAVRYKKKWTQSGYSTPILDKLVFKDIINSLGGMLRFSTVAGAPVREETLSFIECALNVRVVKGYGTTETGGGVIGTQGMYSRTDDVGFPLEGAYIRLEPWEEGCYHPTDKPNPRGEIVVGGLPVASGYFKNESATKESFFDENCLRWFRTGDIGEVYPNGAIKVIDRRKDLIKLAHGEYVSLSKVNVIMWKKYMFEFQVEAVLKGNIYVENVCVYGDSHRSFLVALVSPDVRSLESLATTLGRSTHRLSDICEDEEIVRTVLGSIKEDCQRGKLLRIEIPGRVVICMEEWTPSNGLLTAAMKVRRKEMYNFYKKKIEKLYSSHNSGV